MKLTKTKDRIVEQRSADGLLDCTVTHEIKESRGKAEYVGPKIPEKEWREVLAFLKWVNDTTSSEAQVRAYVNVRLNTWKFWAYPQEAKTGMSAKELDTDQAKEQRRQFKDSEGWIYFGTIHSHCSSSAFQSGVDEANESNQDGLHVTVGKLKDKHYDLHVRFYRMGMCFDPDLDDFWDIGEPWSQAPASFVRKDAIARWQMCEPGGDQFPEIWKTNLVEIKPAGFLGSTGQFHRGASEEGDEDWSRSFYGHGYFPGNTPSDKKENTAAARDQRTQWQKCQDAANELMREDGAKTVEFWEEFDDLMSVACTPIGLTVFELCVKHGIDFDDLRVEMLTGPNQYNIPESAEDELALQQEAEEMKKNSQNGKKSRQSKK